MGQPHPIKLRERVVAFVKEGNGNGETVRRFAPRCRQTRGSFPDHPGLLPLPGRPSPSATKFSADSARMPEPMPAHGEATLNELVSASRGTAS